MYVNRTLRVAKLLFSVLIISHWLCCGWFFAGDTAPRPGQYIPNEIVEGWVSETYPAAVRLGLCRIVALRCRSPTPSQNHKENRYLFF